MNPPILSTNLKDVNMQKIYDYKYIWAKVGGFFRFSRISKRLDKPRIEWGAYLCSIWAFNCNSIFWFYFSVENTWWNRITTLVLPLIYKSNVLKICTLTTSWTCNPFPLVFWRMYHCVLCHSKATCNILNKVQRFR